MTSKDESPLCDGEVRLIYEHGEPHGVRDSTGYLCFFQRVSKLPAQEERYRRELALRARQAEDIAAALRGTSEIACLMREIEQMRQDWATICAASEAMPESESAGIAQLMQLRSAAEEVLRVYMPQFPDSRAVDDCLVGLAAALTPETNPNG